MWGKTIFLRMEQPKKTKTETNNNKTHAEAHSKFQTTHTHQVGTDVDVHGVLEHKMKINTSHQYCIVAQ